MSRRQKWFRRNSVQPRQTRTRRFLVEAMEPRMMLSAVHWTGAGDGTSWTNVNNWDLHALPTAADDVTIDIAGTPTIRLSSGSQAARTLTCAETLVIDGGDLTVADKNEAQLFGSLTLGKSTIHGGTWTLNGGVQFSGTDATLDGVTLTKPLNLGSGQTVTLKNNTLLSGDLSLASSSHLIVGIGENLSVPKPTSLSKLNLTAGDGGVLIFPGVTSLTSVSLTSMSGGQILFPVATSYTGDNYADTTIEATGVGSKIDLSHLQTFAGGGYHTYYSSYYYATHIKAADGGEVDLAGSIGVNPNGAKWNDIQVSDPTTVLGSANVTSLDHTAISVTNGIVAFPTAASLTSVSLTSTGGGQILFPVATSYTGDNYADTTIRAAGAGSKIDLSHLQTFAGGGYHTYYSSYFYATHIEVADGAEVDLAGSVGANPSGAKWNDIQVNGVLGVAGVTAFHYTHLTVTTSAPLTFPSLTEVTDASIVAAPSVILSFPAATKLAAASLTAVGGGQILFPAATSYTGDNYADTTIEATGAGSKIDLSHLQTFAGGGYHTYYSSYYYATHIEVADGGEVDLAGSIGVNSNGAKWNDIQVSDPASVLRASEVTSLDQSSISVTDNIVAFPSAVLLTSVSLAATGGGQISFPVATGYTGDSYADTTIEATGAGSKIDLSHLRTFAGGGYHTYYSSYYYATHIKAADGGEVDLAGSLGINPAGGKTNDITQDGVLSVVDLSDVTNLSRTSLIATNGAAWTFAADWTPTWGSGNSLSTSGTGSSFVNQASLSVSGTSVAVNTSVAVCEFTNVGTLSPVSGGTWDFNGNISVDGQGIITGDMSGKLTAGGDLVGSTTNSEHYEPRCEIRFDGGGTAASPQRWETMGEDRGVVAGGFYNNFAYQKVTVTNGTRVQLVDLSDNAAGEPSQHEAIYVDTIVVSAGTILDLNHLDLYARNAQVTGTVINGQIQIVTDQPPTVAIPANATPNPVTGTTTDLSVLGADDGGEANLTYTWTTVGTAPAAVDFSANGTNAAKNTTATFHTAGTYTFLVTITDAGGARATSSVDVLVNVIGGLIAGPLTPPAGYTPSRFITSGLDAPGGVAIDSAGNLYVANFGNNTVTRTTPGGDTSIFVSSGLEFPVALALDSAGNLFAANQGNSTISKVTPEGDVTVFASAGLRYPSALAFDPAGNLYVADVGDASGYGVGHGTLHKVTPAGDVSTVLSSGLNDPAGLAFDANGNLYIANMGNHTIAKLTPEGVLSTFATSPDPHGLAFDPQGNLYVANQCTFAVSKVKPTGESSVFLNGWFNYPTDLVIGADGSFYVSNWDDDTITKVTPGGLVVEGLPFEGTVFHFTDANPSHTASDYTAVVTLGDGRIATLDAAGVVSGPAGAGGRIVATGDAFDVQLAYTYAKAFNNHTFTVSVSTADGDSVSVSTSDFCVADAPLFSSSAAEAGGVAGVTDSSVLSFATFLDANPGEHPEDFTAMIDWGDGGAESPGAIRYVGASESYGSYIVSASHTYAEEGSYPIRIGIVDVVGGSSTTTITGTATVASAGQPLQIVGGPESVTALPGREFTLAPKYTTSDNSNSLNGLGLRVHFDSSKLQYQDCTDILAHGLATTPQIFKDTDDWDHDLSTDSYVLLAWADTEGTWPNTALPAALCGVHFLPASGLKAGTRTVVHFTAEATSPAYGFQGNDVTVTIGTPITLDVDGDGHADALTDGMLILRYLFSFTGRSLVQGATAPSASRTDSSQIIAYLDSARTTMLDADGSGVVDPLTDGVLLLRYMSGFRGGPLVQRALSADLLHPATRTNPAAIVAFLDQFQPLPAAKSQSAEGKAATDSKSETAYTDEILGSASESNAVQEAFLSNDSALQQASGKAGSALHDAAFTSNGNWTERAWSGQLDSSHYHFNRRSLRM